MSRSRKQSPFFSFVSGGKMKPWRQSVNSSLRARSKQLINNCKDWDTLLLSTIDEVGSLWDSPRDGRLHYHLKPLENKCQHDWTISSDPMRSGSYKLDANGHHKYCNCFGPNSFYDKLFRK